RYGVPGDRFVHDQTGKSQRGWKQEHFEVAWRRYLPPATPENRANRANVVVDPSAADAEPCAEPPPHGSEPLAKPHGSRLRTLRTFFAPYPGDHDYRAYLNNVYDAGLITSRERHDLRLQHDLIVRARLTREAEA